MDLPIRMRIIYNGKYRYAIRLKCGDKFFPSPTKLVPEVKATICSTIKKSTFMLSLSFRHLLSLS